MLAPIALFVYNRPEHLRKTLQALEKNELASQSELFIFSDGPTNDASEDVKHRIGLVRELIRQKWSFRLIHIEESPSNKGLATSIIEGVTKLVKKFGKVVVLEDDLVTSTSFLKYMNRALDLYANENQVMQISGYQFPIDFPQGTPDTFFLPLTTSWGWATWERAWKFFDPLAEGWELLKSDYDLRRRFDLDGSYAYSEMIEAQMNIKNIDSWAIRWWWSVFKVGGLSLFFVRSLCENIGFDNLSTHTQQEPFVQKKLVSEVVNYSFVDKVVINSIAYSSIKKFLSSRNSPSHKSRSILEKIFRTLFQSVK